MKAHSLYVHIPFCAAKCPFCSFAVAVNQDGRVPDYLQVLGREASSYRGGWMGTIYIGGGTPSCLSEESIESLWATLRANFEISFAAEVTFECNPESITLKKAELLRSLGVTRMSLGIQSMNDMYLEYLGRSHRREQAARAFDVLRSAGFDNINVDLMYGFAGQTRQELLTDIREILAFGSEHISIYSLTVEERSLFFARKQLPSEAKDPDLFETVRDELKMGGIRQYEISNFARPGKESMHNMNYWEGGEYLGLGMGAHSHLNGKRFWNADTLPEYLKLMAEKGSAVTGGETLPPAEKMIEALLFGLRMNRGVDLHRLQERFGVELSAEKIEAVESFIEMGLLEEKGMLLRTTARGQLVLDEISARLI